MEFGEIFAPTVYTTTIMVKMALAVVVEAIMLAAAMTTLSDPKKLTTNFLHFLAYGVLCRCMPKLFMGSSFFQDGKFLP